MAFATGHNPPSGFVAGQLSDGAVFGTFLVGNFGSPQQTGVTIKVVLRHFKGLLIPMTSAGNNAAIDNVEPLRVKGREYMTNLKTYPGFVNNTAFNNLLPLLATNAQIASIGIADNALTLGETTGAKIPYTQDADGNVTVFTDPAEQQKKLNEAITTLATKQTATGTTTTETGSKINWRNVIIFTVVGAALTIGAILLFKGKKKK